MGVLPPPPPGIDLLEENSCLRDVSNKDYYLRKKRERAYKQIEEKLGTERAVIKAKITSLRQKCCDLLRPFAWALKNILAMYTKPQHR